MLQEAVGEPLAALLDAGAKIGGSALDAAKRFQSAIAKMQESIDYMLSNAKPANISAAMASLYNPITQMAAEIEQLVSQHGPHDLHLKAMSEAFTALTWLHETTAVQYIEDRLGAVMYHGNKIMMQFKKTPLTEHVEYVKALRALLQSLSVFVKKNFPTGVPWGGAAQAVAAAQSGADMATEAEYRDLQEAVDALVECSKTRGGSISEMAALVAKAFEEHRSVLTLAATNMPPAGNEFLQKLAASLMSAAAFVDEHRRDAQFRALDMLRDLTGLLQWCASQTPVSFIRDNAESIDFNANRILRDEKDMKEWVVALRRVVSKLHQYVAAHHKTGLQFVGQAVSSAAAAASEATAVPLQSVIEEFERAKAQAEALGDVCVRGSDALVQAVKEQISFLTQAASMAKPSNVNQLLEGTVRQINAVTELAEAAQRHPSLSKHAQALAEAANVLCWVGDSKPMSFCKEAVASFEFYANAVMTANKGNQPHIEWAKALRGAVRMLASTVSKQYKTGVIWGGGSPGAAADSTTGSCAAQSSAQEAPVRRIDVANIRRLLTEGDKAARDPTINFNGKPKFELEGDKKWVIEFQASEQFNIPEPKRHHAVYICRCKDATVRIGLKCNSIQIVECDALRLEVNATVGPIEITSARDVQISIRSKCPSVIMSKVRGAKVTLAEEAETECVTNCSSSVVVAVPTEDGGAVETRVPSAFCSVVNGNSVAINPLKAD